MYNLYTNKVNNSLYEYINKYNLTHDNRDGVEFIHINSRA